MKMLVEKCAIALFFLIGFGSVKGGENIDEKLKKEYSNKDSFMNKMLSKFDYYEICKKLETDLHDNQKNINKFWRDHKNEDPETLLNKIKTDKKYSETLCALKTREAAWKWAKLIVINVSDLVILYQLTREVLNEFKLQKDENGMDLVHPAIKKERIKKAVVILRYFVTLYPLYLAEIIFYRDYLGEDRIQSLTNLKNNLYSRFKEGFVSGEIDFKDLKKTINTDLSYKKLYAEDSHRSVALLSIDKEWTTDKLTFQNPSGKILDRLNRKEARFAAAYIREDAIKRYQTYILESATGWSYFWMDVDNEIFKSPGLEKRDSIRNFEESELNAIIEEINKFEINKEINWNYIDTPIFSSKIEKNTKINEIKNEIVIQKNNEPEKKEIKKDEKKDLNTENKDEKKK